MLNHARELDAAGFETVLIGYGGNNLDLPSGIDIRSLHPMRRIDERQSKLTFVAGSALRMALLFFELISVLIRERAKIVLVQNAPAFPTLAAAWIAARCSGARLVIDWHNYSYSLLALRLGLTNALVRAAEWYEGFFGRRADAHVCVSQAMRDDLLSRWRIHASTLYDRPLQIESSQLAENLTVVCPAGWTKDEDMDLLLESIALLETRAIQFHLTGDGPLRAGLEPRIAELRKSGFDILTGFLPETQYRALIRSASLGLSLHRSTSGLDLAMKVVDFFAAAVPVCALDYGGALPEQIVEGETGFLFRSAEQLAAILTSVAAEPPKLNQLRENLRSSATVTWHDEWTRVVLPILQPH